MIEPRLRPDDLRLWEGWRRTACLHARSLEHRRAVEQARAVVEAAAKLAPTSCYMLSGGKDSSVLVHLAAVELGLRLPVLSEKDDLDYPGERAHVEALAAAWGLDLQVLEPELSPAAWFAAHAADLGPGADLHSRAAALSKTCFYDLVERAAAPFAGIFLGLRAEESRARAVDQATHFHTDQQGRRLHGLYQRLGGANPGQWRVCPLHAWRGIDVYAYAETHGLEFLPLYRCIAFMHAREPWRLRKSWWVPGTASRHGGTAWLAHYYPSLFAQLRRWLPAAQGFY
jgi:3'-phosphoadenosine 5'-phosphosulfate sulfotransferase (PAPS reductase)/FAD synthetase